MAELFNMLVVAAMFIGAVIFHQAGDFQNAIYFLLMATFFLVGAIALKLEKQKK